MKRLRACGHALLFFFFADCIAYTSIPTPRQRLPTSATTAIMTEKIIISSSLGPSIRVSMNHVVSRSSFLSTAALATLMTPIVAAAITPEAPRASSSTRSNATQQIEHSIPNQEKAATELSSVQESISGFFAGGALTATKTILKYPLDTATVRLQVPGYGYSISELGRLFSGSYNGVTASLLANIPAGAVFFAVKDAAKTSLKNSALVSAPAWATTTLAVGAALIPYWIIRSPSELIKVRQQVGVFGYGEGVSAWDALQLTFNATASEGGSTLERVGAVYTGYWENILYSLPADVIKFVAYEALTGGKKDLLPIEGAQAGAFATAAAQLVTTPLDVVRNRRMTSSRVKPNDSSGEHRSNYIETLAKLGKEEGVAGLFAGATPRVAKAFLSGAIQFATYEETKQSISRYLMSR